MFRKQRFEIRRKNKSDFFDHSTTLKKIDEAFYKLNDKKILEKLTKKFNKKKIIYIFFNF